MFKKTNSGLLVPHKGGTRFAHCTCGRVVDKERESRKMFWVYQGQVMCAVCRVMKLGRHGQQLNSSQNRKEAREDFDRGKFAQAELERKRIEEVAADSNTRTIKNLNA